MEDLKQPYLDELKRLSNLEYRDDIKIVELTENFNGMSIEIRKKEKLLQLEQLANLSTHPSKHLNSFCYDDDDDEDYTIAVTPSLPIEEPDNSLSMGDEHLDIIPATKSDEVIKSSVEDLIPIPSESEVTPSEPIDCLSMGDKHLDIIPATKSDELIKSSVEDLVPIPSESEGENGCDVPSCFTTFSNILFDDEYEFDYVDDQSLHNEDFSEKIFSNPLFEEEISSIKKNQHHFNAQSDLVESML
nr:hypothetical protein [Tanacetum cinerariifolium]